MSSVLCYSDDIPAAVHAVYLLTLLERMWLYVVGCGGQQEHKRREQWSDLRETEFEI